MEILTALLLSGIALAASGLLKPLMFTPTTVTLAKAAQPLA